VLAGVDVIHVPCRGGGPALETSVAGQARLMFPFSSAALALLAPRAGWQPTCES